MNNTQRKILLAFAFIPIFFLIGFLFESFLVFLGNVDEYGTPKNKYLGWIYDIFHQRDGLYDMPNMFFLLLIIIINMFLFKFIFNYFIKDNN